MFFREFAPVSWASISSCALATSLLVVVVLCLPVLPALGQEWEEPTEESQALTPSAGGIRFGKSVAISGDRLVAGAYFDGDNGGRSGSAHIFHLDPDTGKWLEEEKLTASDGARGDEFGVSVSISGELLVVGAWRDADDGPASGSAYVFRFDGDTQKWVEEQKLTASDGGGLDKFGTSVSISGERLVVGAYRDGSGSAYVFRFDADNEEWVEEEKLTASDAVGNVFFGYSVSISGERLVVGAYRDGGDNASGSAYVFRFDADNEEWVEEERITASDGAALDYFGFAVSISGERLVVGAFRDSDDGASSGSAYVFRFDADDEEWAQEEKLTASDAAGIDMFGRSVDICGERLVVGARFDDDNAHNSGSAYVFHFDPDREEWVEENKLTASDGAELDYFGESVSISGECVVVGASGVDVDEDTSGAAYVFELGAASFLRGDADNSGAVNAFSDGLFLLRFELQEGDPPECAAAADADGSGDVSAVSDAIFLFRWSFLEGDPPPDPGPSECGPDPDDAECEVPPECG